MRKISEYEEKEFLSLLHSFLNICFEKNNVRHFAVPMEHRPYVFNVGMQEIF